jgi:hypothetical protein
MNTVTPTATPQETPQKESPQIRKPFLKKNATILSIFFLVLGLVAVAGVLTTAQITQKQNQDVRSDASTDTMVNFAFGSLTATAAPNQEFTNTVKVQTNGKQLSAAAISLLFNPEFTQVVSITPTDKLPVILQAAAIDNTNGTAKITLGASGAAGSAFNGEGDIATVKMKGLKATTSTVKLKYDAATLQAAVIGQDTNAAQVTGEVLITISGSSTTPTARITMPSATCTAAGAGNKFKASEAINFTTQATPGIPAANESMVFISKVAANGSDLETMGTVGESCLAGAGIISGTAGTSGYWCKIATTAITGAQLDKVVTWTSPTPGKYVVTINAMVPGAGSISCSGNPKCAYSTDSPFPKTSCNAFVNCSESDWHQFEVLTASSCPTDPAPTPTPKPSPSATPQAGTPSLNLKFKLQGLRKEGIRQTAAVTVKYLPAGQTTPVTKSFTKEYLSNATGTLASDTPLVLDGVTTSAAIANAEVYVKLPTSLMKKIGTTTLTPNAAVTITSDVVLPVGDFKNDGADKNIIKLNDLALALTEFKQLENPVTDANRLYDVDFSGSFNLQDIALVLTNFDQLEYPGETP